MAFAGNSDPFPRKGKRACSHVRSGGLLALTNATLPYAVRLANKGWKQALKENAALRKGLNMHEGKVTYPGVAEAFGLELHDPTQFLS